ALVLGIARSANTLVRLRKGCVGLDEGRLQLNRPLETLDSSRVIFQSKLDSTEVVSSFRIGGRSLERAPQGGFSLFEVALMRESHPERTQRGGMLWIHLHSAV